MFLHLYVCEGNDWRIPCAEHAQKRRAAPEPYLIDLGQVAECPANPCADCEAERQQAQLTPVDPMTAVHIS